MARALVRALPNIALGTWLSVSVACSSGPLPLGRLDDLGAGPNRAEPDPSAAPDASTGGDGGDRCAPPLPARHYTFDGTGTEVVDVRGGAPGRVRGAATLDGSGVVRLNGGDDYVDLPNGILAGLEEVSVAVWLRRRGGPAYARIFDFGTGSLGEDPPIDAAATGRSYLAATPGTGNVPSGVAVLMSSDGPPNEVVALSDVVLDDRMHLVVAAVARDTVSLYVDAALVARVPRTVSLASIVDHNAWLGRSQYSADPHITADFADLRTFEGALPDCAVRALFSDGPEPP